jgi:hypothetical protein
MRYKPKSVAALHVVLGSWPAQMRVEIDRGVGVSAKTVGELRKISRWPENLAVTTPHEHYRGCTIKVSKASHATRLSPKA